MKTRDGVEVDPQSQECWYIPWLQEADFRGLHRGKIPNKTLAVSPVRLSATTGKTSLLDGRNYASSPELANRYAVLDFINRLKDRERDLEYELKSLKSKRDKISQRLSLHLEQQKG